MTLQAGKLDRKITIQRRTVVISESGDVTEEWTNLYARYSASMWSFRASEAGGAPAITSFEQIEFRVRYSEALAELSPKDRIICPALTAAQRVDDDYVVPERNIYDIVGVLEINRREGFKIITNRRPDIE